MGKRKILVELVLRQERDSEFPKLCIATNNEIAKNPMILTDITFVRHPGPDFTSSDGSDFRENAIRHNAPSNANAYLGKGMLTEQAALFWDRYSVIYLHIDEEQANRASRFK